MSKIVKYGFKNDLIFKGVLQKNPKAAYILAKKYIADLKNLEYKEGDFEIKSPFNISGVELKTTEYDIKFLVCNDMYIEFEMQNNNPTYNIKHRMIKYMVDLEHGSFLKGDYKFKKCYSLWFLNFKLFNDNLAIHTVANMVKETKEEFALEVGCITIVELVKFDKTEYNKDVWKQIFFTNDLSLIKGDDEVMDKVKDTIEYMNDDEMLREILIALDRKERNENAERNAVKEKAEAEGLAKGLSEGLAKGLAEGKKQSVEEIVISSYENKLSLELISTITKLTVDEIKEVLKKNNINVED